MRGPLARAGVPVADWIRTTGEKNRLTAAERTTSAMDAANTPRPASRADSGMGGDQWGASGVKHPHDELEQEEGGDDRAAPPVDPTGRRGAPLPPAGRDPSNGSRRG